MKHLYVEVILDVINALAYRQAWYKLNKNLNVTTNNAKKTKSFSILIVEGLTILTACIFLM
jgi:hypothetical protein